MASLPRYPAHAEVVWRPLAANDIAYVAALEAQIHAAPWTSENFREALAAGYSARVAEREGRIIAYGVLMRAPGEAQLLNLSVVPDARRTGLGSELLTQFLADARVLGAEQVFLEVRESNEPAIALYMRAGFQSVARREFLLSCRKDRRTARGRVGHAAQPDRPRIVMATREDMLVELGLTPTWRRRESDNEVQVEFRREAQVEAAVNEPALRTGPPSAPMQDGAARSARIAALSWEDFAADVDACNACGLCKTRNRSVPGVGDVNAEWLFVGEAPGAEEDARGEPFVGQAGRLLDNMLMALGLSRTRNVYIANVLKCRPPNNRTPEPRETDACRVYLERQVALIRPKLIVALGKSAASLLLNSDATIASLRGRVHEYRGVPLIVTYHPAYLLRNLPDKAKAWEDMLLARRTVVTSERRMVTIPPPLE